LSKYLKRGIKSFYSRNFEDALLYFSLALKEHPNSKEARVSAILAEFAIEKEDEAIALYEYYLVNKDIGVKNSEELVEEIVDSVELTLESLEALFSADELEAKINEENGIAYDDFRAFINSKESFREAFEDIMFSTKVIIHKKNDFIDFISQLRNNGFEDMSMTYFEAAIQIFPHDKQLLRLINDNKTK